MTTNDSEEVNDEEDSEEDYVRPIIIRRKIVIFGVIVYLILAASLLLLPPIGLGKVFPDYQQASQLINTAVQIIAGAFVLLAIFYLGKFHDYNREFISQNANFEGIREIIEQKFSTPNIDDDAWIKRIKELSKTFEDIEKDFKEYPKLVIQNVVYMLLPAGGLYTLSFFNIFSENKFLVLVLILGFLIYLFLVIWYLYEEKIEDHDHELKEITHTIAYLRAQIE